MEHTFFMEAGKWSLSGHWLERDQPPIPIEGKTIVAWSRENWFTMVTKLVFPEDDRADIALQYRGRLDNERQYTFVLQHSELGRVEGEGWIAMKSIVQRYWVLGDKQRRTGFEASQQIDKNTYYLSSSIMAGHYLTSTMDVTMERHA
ncbi:MAG: hypothetical protein HC916_10765 [Coleofasciculaceae cyanobacterium SM2_1_6]|nr:hypothetical protein [Coleofasciculaceae cyanobacterium SM2_1_6]